MQALFGARAHCDQASALLDSNRRTVWGETKWRPSSCCVSVLHCTLRSDATRNCKLRYRKIRNEYAIQWWPVSYRCYTIFRLHGGTPIYPLNTGHCKFVRNIGQNRSLGGRTAYKLKKGLLYLPSIRSHFPDFISYIKWFQSSFFNRVKVKRSFVRWKYGQIGILCPSFLGREVGSSLLASHANVLTRSLRSHSTPKNVCVGG